MRVLIVHNPEAGTGETSRDDIRALFADAGHAPVIRHVKHEPVVPEDAEAADMVVVAGGDGTVGAAIRALHDVDRPFVLVPLGTANNVARCLGLPHDPREIAQGCGGWAERRLDLGFAEGPWGERPFVEGVGLGALADLVVAGEAQAAGYEDKIRFAADAPAPIVRGAKPLALAGAVDDLPLPAGLLLLECLNMPVVGPGLAIGRGGWPEDGLLDIALLREEGRDAFVRWLDGDRHPPAPGIERRRGARIDIRWQGERLRIDDDIPDWPGRPATVTLRVARRRLRVLVPPEGKAAP